MSRCKRGPRWSRCRGWSCIALDLDEATDAAAVAVAARLRGADATYVAIAVRTGSTLVTLDAELLERAAALVPVATPEAWLAGAA